jgi:hypothetical protein
MTYIVKYLSDYESLKKELELHPENIKYYSKYEGFTGSSKSIEYINQKIKEYKNENKKN